MAEENQVFLNEGKTISEEAILQFITQFKTTIQNNNNNNSKVDKIEGKGLSSNDFTDAEKNKLEGIEENAKASIIKSVSVNGVPLSIVDKNIDISTNWEENYSFLTDSEIDDLWSEATGNLNWTWKQKIWNIDFYSSNVWTDGENIYYSNGSEQYKLSKSTYNWRQITWEGDLINFFGSNVWTDGENIYYSNEDEQYILNKDTNTWEEQVWFKNIPSYGANIWTDGENVYYSDYDYQYIVNRNSLNQKIWSGNLTSFSKSNIWTDGENIYYSEGNKQYKLNKDTGIWEEKIWYGNTVFYGKYIWKDKKNIYYSNGNDQYILDKDTSTWYQKEWYGYNNIIGNYIWSEEENIYYSNGNQQYILE